MIKWFMHNPEPLLENETCKIPWDFEIQTKLNQMTSPNDYQKKKVNLSESELNCSC